MTVNTKKVSGRRTVRYESYADMLADAEAMVASDIKLVGNWSLGQILKHLAFSHHFAVDGANMSIPWPMKFVMKLAMKNRFLNKGLPSGYTIPKKMESVLIAAEDTVAPQALEDLRAAVERVQSSPTLAKHGMFDELTHEEWEKFNLRHAEMHMSFVVPQS